jgi:hypothetical protein
MAPRKNNKLKKDFIIPVGGKNVHVRRVKGLKVGDQGVWGEFDEDDDGSLIIKIDSEASGEALYHTLGHEFLHAVFHVSGYAFIFEKITEGLEEGVVRCIENMYIELIKNLQKYIEENS